MGINITGFGFLDHLFDAITTNNIKAWNNSFDIPVLLSANC
jgi:hypothetical protein